MAAPCSANELLDMYYLETRCHLLEVAATFDRLARAPAALEAAADPRLLKLRAAVKLLQEDGGELAEKFLNLLSD